MFCNHFKTTFEFYFKQFLVEKFEFIHPLCTISSINESLLVLGYDKDTNE